MAHRALAVLPTLFPFIITCGAKTDIDVVDDPFCQCAARWSAEYCSAVPRDLPVCHDAVVLEVPGPGQCACAAVSTPAGSDGCDREVEGARVVLRAWEQGPWSVTLEPERGGVTHFSIDPRQPCERCVEPCDTGSYGAFGVMTSLVPHLLEQQQIVVPDEPGVTVHVWVCDGTRARFEPCPGGP